MKHSIKRPIPKYMSNINIVKYACLILIVFPVLNSCSTYRINRLKNKSYKEWKTSKWTETKRSSDKEIAEWVIYSRKVKGTNFLEYKIEGNVQSPPKDCIEAFKNDIYRLADGAEDKKYPTYDILDETDENLFTYVIHNEPFPFKDTEMSVKYKFYSNEDGATGVKWKEAWENSKIPPSKKLKRVETFRGTWSFSPVTGNSCKALNIVQFDPKGMPMWLVQPMVSKFLKKGLEKLRTSSSD